MTQPEQHLTPMEFGTLLALVDRDIEAGKKQREHFEASGQMSYVEIIDRREQLLRSAMAKLRSQPLNMSA